MEKEINITNDTQLGKNLTFIIDNETYGLEIKYVRQIIGVQKVTPIPDQPVYIKGIINLRGQIIPIIDIRLKFGKNEVEYDDRTCIIILDINDMTVGVIVDSVAEVITVNDEDISKAPDFTENINNKYLRGIGKINERVYILLDCNELLKHNK